MTPQQFMSYLVSLKAQVESMSVTLDLLIMQHHANLKKPEPDPNAPCRHPEDRRLPTPAMGHPNRSLCGICGAEVE